MALSLAMACGTAARPPMIADRTTGDAGVNEDAEADAEPAADENAESDGDVEATSSVTESEGPCPANMVLVAAGEARFCIDTYEASLVEVDTDGNEKAYPHWLPVDGHVVRAISEPNTFPQGFISEVQAEDACAASNKRLCSHVEWKTACMGPTKTTFPYGNTRSPGVCHDVGKSAVGAVFGARAMTDPVAKAPTAHPRNTQKASSAKNAGGNVAIGKAADAKPGRRAHVSIKGRAAETSRPRAPRPGSSSMTTSARTKKTSDKAGARAPRRAPARASVRPASVEPSVWTQLNDPRLGQVDGALARTGSHDACVNGYGAVDMVGNLHEWVRTDPSAAHGTFAGGYYLDTTLNGDGCHYRTTAHAHDYHDYSTGFRCCAEAKADATSR